MNPSIYRGPETVVPGAVLDYVTAALASIERARQLVDSDELRRVEGELRILRGNVEVAWLATQGRKVD